MKIVIIGLNGATPEQLLEDERLTTVRSLMEAGSYGRLRRVIPAGPVPGWMCLATGRDPGSLGVYGLRSRANGGYAKDARVDSRSFDAPAMWDRVASAGGRSILIGVPPGYPPRPVAGIAIADGCPPDKPAGAFVQPPELAEAFERRFGPYPCDPCDLERIGFMGPAEDAHLETSRRQFEVVRRLMAEESWDYFHFVDHGLDGVRRSFPSEGGDGEARSRAILDYLAHFDAELARVLEIVPEDAAVLVASVHGGRESAGCFAVNEWLVREGLLGLKARPDGSAVSLERADVDWSTTAAWAEAGHGVRIFLNVRGREPEGFLDPADREAVSDDLKARVEGLVDPERRPIGWRAFKPEEIHREHRGPAPDLFVDVADSGREPLAGVGYSSIFPTEAEGGIGDGCVAADGAFVLAGALLPPFGPIEDVGVLDVAPTLLELAGLPPLADLSGRNFLEGREPIDPAAGAGGLDDDELVRDRLRGLGYIG